MKNFGKSSRGHSQGIPKIFRAPIYGAHCAVIFAIAQLSCMICYSIAAIAIHLTEAGLYQDVHSNENVKN